MLHGYCIRLTGQAGPEGVRGIDGSRVELLESGGLGVWYSRVESAVVTAARLRQHEMVVRFALRSATPLPLRFGSTFADEMELVRHLDDRSDELAGKLGRFENLVEIGVRVSQERAEGLPPADPQVTASPAEPSTGRQYLEARRHAVERAASAQEAARVILESVATELAVPGQEYVIEVDTSGRSMGSMAHLLHRGEVPLFLEKLPGVQQRRPDLRIRASGPWAPYSFV